MYLVIYFYIQQLVQKHAEMESELAQAYDKLKEAESKVEHTSNQLALLLVREKKMMKEKRDAQRQLDHAKVQIARNLRYVTCTCIHCIYIHVLQLQCLFTKCTILTIVMWLVTIQYTRH